MPERFRVLRSVELEEPVGYRRPEGTSPADVDVASPASDAMTDLARLPAYTVSPDTCVDDALQRMIHCGVRLLLVTDADQRVLGLVTARDIMGEKPVHYASQNRIPHADVRVEHVMVPTHEIDVLRLEDVREACVGDVIVTLRADGRQHALVVEPDGEAGGSIIRGIFSATQIGRQLGVEIEPTGIKQSFGELERVLQAEPVTAD